MDAYIRPLEILPKMTIYKAAYCPGSIKQDYDLATEWNLRKANFHYCGYYQYWLDWTYIYAFKILL